MEPSSIRLSVRLFLINADRQATASPAMFSSVIPNITRGPGFLGAKAGYIYLTDTSSGPNGLSRPTDITKERRSRREQLLAKMRAGYRQQMSQDQFVKDYDDTLAEALRLSGPNFMKVFNLDAEPADLRNAYGGEFGQRCLLVSPT